MFWWFNRGKQGQWLLMSLKNCIYCYRVHTHWSTKLVTQNFCLTHVSSLVWCYTWYWNTFDYIVYQFDHFEFAYMCHIVIYIDIWKILVMLWYCCEPYHQFLAFIHSFIPHPHVLEGTAHMWGPHLKTYIYHRYTYYSQEKGITLICMSKSNTVLYVWIKTDELS